ncbi:MULTISPECIES: hypothetical protein [Halomonadaceae]|uniref:Uncharacterized protein n=1 Tax=Vreelandella halophila TaxID=86177 RepID=A0A9X5B515_9GAMM|nr:MULTISPECIES: hypothetical protein [Halomonas]MYL26039.1 hypothetical protein [Halomonas utahensis]MYL73399.1 hypothetical protein [Halomonas sp. 22501_18_FS]
MEDELEHFLGVRDTLLASDSASPDQLKAYDRQLFGTLAKQAAGASALLSSETDTSEVANLFSAEPGRLLCVLEARDRLWPGELERVHSSLIHEHDHGEIAWWLAAHYRHLACPTDFPETFTAQVWAARALTRRGYIPPAPWTDWHAAIQQETCPRAVALTLWDTGDGDLWQEWLPPLLAATDDTRVAALINALAPEVTDAALIGILGATSHSRFLPWLASFRHDESLAEPALREVRWLVGDREERHRGRQLWGMPLEEVNWKRLFRVLPLGFRERLWPACSHRIEGTPVSLHGGRWCPGN